jgi:hypothetical protein
VRSGFDGEIARAFLNDSLEPFGNRAEEIVPQKARRRLEQPLRRIEAIAELRTVARKIHDQADTNIVFTAETRQDAGIMRTDCGDVIIDTRTFPSKQYCRTIALK